MLWRLWTNSKEEVVKLIVVGEEGLQELLAETHGFDPNHPSSIAHLRESLAGFPKRLQVDNALLTRHSKTRKFLESNGVRIYHGHAYVSRCQGVADDWTPKMVHFVRPTTSFLHWDPETEVTQPKSVTSGIRAAQKASFCVLEENVKAAGDQLIKVNLSETAMIQLVKSMEESAAKGVPRPSYPRTRGRTALDINSIDWFAVLPR